MRNRLILLLIALIIGSPLLLAGCNTIQGAGRDIEQGGQKIQDEATEHKPY
ncbi:MAG TPA: entericidin A/B family lipoprotein [Candidatus Acidoferrales bacterium]|nr:entericidin A/B family lipoprotein [Candidatus Acidoferrales bacterium]